MKEPTQAISAQEPLCSSARCKSASTRGRVWAIRFRNPIGRSQTAWQPSAQGKRAMPVRTAEAAQKFFVQLDQRGY